MLSQTGKNIEKLSPAVSVLIVDDSAVIRGFLRRFLEEALDIKVTASVENGELAVKEVEKKQFDVVILDIEMPIMDGLTALPLILKKDPAVHVIMASTLTQKNAVVTFKALQLGATECLPKPSSTQDMLGSANNFKEDLIRKTRELAVLTRKKRNSIKPAIVNNIRDTPLGKNDKIILRPLPLVLRPEIIVIGSSTGGPKALTDIFSAWRGVSLSKPIFITQHMPEKFTLILANNLEKYSGFTCHEAEDGEEVKNGVVYVAPGNYHMLCQKKGDKVFIKLTQDEAENFCRPAVDPMLRSLISVYGGNKILSIILTGMGQDGKSGCKALVEAGGTVFAQDEESSVVWGMPAAVAQSGLCSKILPLENIADDLRSYL